MYINFELPPHPSNDCQFQMDAVSLLSHPLYADNKLIIKHDPILSLSKLVLLMPVKSQVYL